MCHLIEITFPQSPNIISIIAPILNSYSYPWHFFPEDQSPEFAFFEIEIKIQKSFQFGPKHALFRDLNEARTILKLIWHDNKTLALLRTWEPPTDLIYLGSVREICKNENLNLNNLIGTEDFIGVIEYSASSENDQDMIWFNQNLKKVKTN